MKYWYYVLCTVVCGFTQSAVSIADQYQENQSDSQVSEWLQGQVGGGYTSQGTDRIPSNEPESFLAYESNSYFTPESNTGCIKSEQTYPVGEGETYLYASQPCCENPCCPPVNSRLEYGPLRITIEGLIGQGIGGNNENGAAELFWAPSVGCGSWVPFIDLKYHHLGSSSSWAANGGLGFRCLDPWDRTLGVNVFYDYRFYRHTEFNQIGIGIESLGEIVDVRFNGYFPFNKSGKYSMIFDDYIGNYIVEASEVWMPMTGVDGEVGFTMYNNHCFRLYGAIGSYYYWDTDRYALFNKKHALGAMGRLSVQWTEFLTLQVKATYDELFKTKVQGSLQLTVPFEKWFDVCKWANDTCANIFLKPVERREVIVLHHSDILWLGNY